MRDVIREDILKCLEQKPADFEELLKLLQQEKMISGIEFQEVKPSGWKKSC